MEKETKKYLGEFFNGDIVIETLDRSDILKDEGIDCIYIKPEGYKGSVTLRMPKEGEKELKQEDFDWLFNDALLSLSADKVYLLPNGEYSDVDIVLTEEVPDEVEDKFYSFGTSLNKDLVVQLSEKDIKYIKKIADSKKGKKGKESESDIYPSMVVVGQLSESDKLGCLSDSLRCMITPDKISFVGAVSNRAGKRAKDFVTEQVDISELELWELES